MALLTAERIYLGERYPTYRNCGEEIDVSSLDFTLSTRDSRRQSHHRAGAPFNRCGRGFEAGSSHGGQLKPADRVGCTVFQSRFPPIGGGAACNRFPFGQTIQLAVREAESDGLRTAGRHVVFRSYDGGPHVFVGTPSARVRTRHCSCPSWFGGASASIRSRFWWLPSFTYSEFLQIFNSDDSTCFNRILVISSRIYC